MVVNHKDKHAMDAVLTCQNLTVALSLNGSRYPVIENLSFKLMKAKTFALVGESGCGKSMTALALTQLLPPIAHYRQGSEVFLENINIAEQSEVSMQQFRGIRIAMIFQEPMTALNPVMSIGAQIEETLKVHAKMTHAQRYAKVLDLLEAVGIPDPKQRYKEYPHQLSGGMKQRVVIAIAIALQPDILIADEPTTALDVTIQAQILALLRKLQQENGMSILLISHDLGVVSQMADEVAVMYAGRIVEQGAMDGIINNPLHPYTRQLLAAIPSLALQDKVLTIIPGSVPSITATKAACAFAERCQFAWDRCYHEAPKRYTPRSQHDVCCHLFEKNQDVAAVSLEQPLASVDKKKQQQKPILTATGLVLHFPIKKGLLQRTVAYAKAVDGVDLSIKKHHTLALVGESGCGKTTLGKAMSLLLKPTAGHICLDDKTVYDHHTCKEKFLHQSLQMIFQDPFSSLNPRMVVAQLLAEGLKHHSHALTKQQRSQRILEVLHQVGLSEDVLQRYPHEFSGGQRQRISIARSLLVEPEVIICDEPTSALDLSVQAKILNLLKQLQQEKGLAYLFITHDISVVSYMADEVAVMYLGRIVEQGSVQEVLTTPKHPYTQALLRAVPQLTQEASGIPSVAGDIPSPINPPQGCHFAARCPHVMQRCYQQYPMQTQLSHTHKVHCYLYGTGATQCSQRKPTLNAKVEA